jgi:hypothetical protein
VYLRSNTYFKGTTGALSSPAELNKRAHLRAKSGLPFEPFFAPLATNYAFYFYHLPAAKRRSPDRPNFPASPQSTLAPPPEAKTELGTAKETQNAAPI